MVRKKKKKLNQNLGNNGGLAEGLEKEMNGACDNGDEGELHHQKRK